MLRQLHEDALVNSDLPLIGRHVELSTVAGTIDAARQGRGEGVLITGEAGIGKSRLLREARIEAGRRGLLVLKGRAVESGGAYRPLVEAFARPAAPFAQDPDLAGVRPTLARVLPGWVSAQGVLAPMADPAAVLAEALMLLVQRIAADGGILILDDLHWADPDTLSVLASMVDSVDTLPLAIVMAARAEPVPPAALQQLGAARSIHLMPLRRLTPAEVGDALRASQLQVAGGQVDQLVAVVDGLPLILDEFARQIREGGSRAGRLDLSRSTLASAVQLRLAGVSAESRLVLDALSVLGDTDAEVLVAATGIDKARLGPALHGGLASTLLVTAATPLGVSWRHRLIGDGVRDLLLPLEQQAIAHRAADQLANGTELSDGDPRQAASLYRLAGYPQQAAQQLIRAARIAVRNAALEVADEHLAEAHALTGSIPESARDVLIERIETLVLAGRASDAYESGAAALRSVGGPDARRLLVATVRAAFAADQYQDGRDLLARLDRESESVDADLAALRAHAALADRVPEAISLGHRAAVQAQEQGRMELACEALLVVAVAARRRDTNEAVAALRQSLELSRTHQLAVWEVRALAELGVLDMMTASDATRLQQARSLATSAGMVGTVAKMDVAIAKTIICRQGFRAAYQTVLHADTQARQLRLTGLQAQTLGHLAECLLFAEDQPLPGETRPPTPTDVDAVVAEAISLADKANQPPYISGLLGVRAWFHGDNTTAISRIQQATWAVPEELRIPPWWGFAALLRAIGGTHPVEASVDLLGHHTNRAAHAYATALWELRAGRLPQAFIDEAELHLRHTPFWRHLLRTVIAPVVFEAGISAAEGWLREADAFCSASGERGLQRRVRHALAAIGVKVPRTTGVSVPPHLARLGITAREAEILRLVNAGVSNPDIAERLFISIRTVETHVSSMLQKTGTESRDQLPVAVAEA